MLGRRRLSGMSIRIILSFLGVMKPAACRATADHRWPKLFR